MRSRSSSARRQLIWSRLETESVIHSDSDFATVAFLRIKDARLEPKCEVSIPDVAVPNLLDEEFMAMAVTISESQPITEEVEISVHQPSIQRPASPYFPLSVKRAGDWISIANIHRDTATDIADISLDMEVQECFQILQSKHRSSYYTRCSAHPPSGLLANHSLHLSHLTNLNVFISSMDYFVHMNAVYATFFGSSPPARACVAVDLPASVRIRLDCIAFVEHVPGSRQALHVQGLSYWAPANIGPYSQAVIVRHPVHHEFMCDILIMTPTGGRTRLHLGANRTNSWFPDTTITTVAFIRGGTLLPTRLPRH